MRAITWLLITINCILFAGSSPGELQLTNRSMEWEWPISNLTNGSNSQGYQVPNGLQDLVNSWIRGPKIDGLACGIKAIRNGAMEYDIFVINTTTNGIFGCLRLPIAAIANVELVDANGKAVPKSSLGKEFNGWTTNQIDNWYNEMARRNWGRRGFRLNAMFFEQIGRIDILKIFEIKQPGVFTFHLTVRLVRTDGSKPGRFLITVLPEVVAKVQIRPGDIMTTKAGSAP